MLQDKAIGAHWIPERLLLPRRTQSATDIADGDRVRYTISLLVPCSDVSRGMLLTLRRLRLGEAVRRRALQLHAQHPLHTKGQLKHSGSLQRAKHIGATYVSCAVLPLASVASVSLPLAHRRPSAAQACRVHRVPTPSRPYRTSSRRRARMARGRC